MESRHTPLNRPGTARKQMEIITGPGRRTQDAGVGNAAGVGVATLNLGELTDTHGVREALM